MKAKTNSVLQRWFALALVVVNIAFNYFGPFMSGGNSIREVSERYSNLFMPAPYAFAIWGLIYLAVLIYAVVQALPAQKNETAYHELAFSLVFLSILSMSWLLSFTSELMGLSEVIIVAMLITSVHALIKARGFAAVKQLGQWAVVPFSLYAGWLSVATIANTSAWLVSIGYTGGSVGPEGWAIIMVGIAVIIGAIESFRYKDIVYPLVIAWGIIAIWAGLNTTASVGTASLFGGGALIVIAIINLVRNEYITRGGIRKNRVVNG